VPDPKSEKPARQTREGPTEGDPWTSGQAASPPFGRRCGAHGRRLKLRREGPCGGGCRDARAWAGPDFRLHDPCQRHLSRSWSSGHRLGRNARRRSIERYCGPQWCAMVSYRLSEVRLNFGQPWYSGKCRRS